MSKTNSIIIPQFYCLISHETTHPFARLNILAPLLLHYTDALYHCPVVVQYTNALT